MWYGDKLAELRKSEMISIDDQVYVIPFHLVDRHNTFSDLKKVQVVSVETKGSNARGCEVTGRVVTYGRDAMPIEQFYSGNAIYRYRPGGGVLTQEGVKWPIYSREAGCMVLMGRPLVQLWCRFRASDGLYIEVPVAKGMYFRSPEDAVSYGFRHVFHGCFLYIDRLECLVDGFRVVFSEYGVVKDEDVFMSSVAKMELWDHMVANERPVIQNRYGMAFSKVFLLDGDCLVARKGTGEFLQSAKYPVPSRMDLGGLDVPVEPGGGAHSA